MDGTLCILEFIIAAENDEICVDACVSDSGDGIQAVQLGHADVHNSQIRYVADDQI